MTNVRRRTSKTIPALLMAGVGLVVAGVAGTCGEVKAGRQPVVQSAEPSAPVPSLAQPPLESLDPTPPQVLPAEPSGPAGPFLNRTDEAAASRRKMTLSWAQTGWKLVAAGEYRRAAQVFARATELAPHDASLFVGLGLSQHRLSRDDLAVATLEHALQLDANAGQAHHLLGDIHYARREIRTALRHYETARRLDPNDVMIQDRLLTTRRESRAEAGLHRLFSPHFVVKFQGPTDRHVASAVADRLELTYKTVGSRLAYFPPGSFTVVLYSAPQFRHATFIPYWARGLFDGRIHLSLAGMTGGPNVADALLTHEYTHAVVHRLSNGHAPTWLHEGLALYFEGGAKPWGRDYLSRHAWELMPLQSLHGSFLELTPRAARIAYAESYGAATALIHRYGLVRVRELLAALAATPDFPSTFEKVLQDRYDEFDATWVRARAEQRF